MESLWQVYKSVYFELSQPLSAQLDFAIVTAHNPLGQICSAGQNATLDRLLQAEIVALSVPYRSLVGCDLQKSHMEKSWAVAVDKAVAIQLAKNYQQNALYWVSCDQLYLVPAMIGDGYRQELVGRFSDRVVSNYDFEQLAAI
ncbi:hypothetical protein DS2_09522 [Catenovulum agarivorans DS-2]|uniref:DUF3293 domain-containing protein n=1 Tax=Catenovulum agarivorans DS-2 TaxID=1328313 RepID=W7QDM8_9ALTE|nr:DUF3293 domain-containing protein [Catenovulum agarivorans]EWH10021.1 hypothetical protein DS2_09522 [Catenovulum agarivorans DS-2]